jgi:meiotic recombination protein DMC1
VKSLLTVTKKHLIELKGLSDAKVDKMLEAAHKLLPASGFVTAAEFMDLRRDTVHIRTGADSVDAILDGGVQTRCLTELFGEWRTGKTQLCHTLAVTTQLELKDGGGFAKVAWIDTEGTFTAKRIVQIADRFNLDPRCVLDNILVARTFTSEMMHNAVVALAAKMAEAPFKLLVVDSVMAHFRVDFVGRGELSERQQKLGQFLAMLNKLADEFNVAVVYTNQVQADPSGMSFAGADPKKAVGGHVLAHASHVRCAVRKGRGGNRVLKVVDAPSLKEAEAEFEITDGGVVAADV